MKRQPFSSSVFQAVHNPNNSQDEKKNKIKRWASL